MNIKEKGLIYKIIAVLMIVFLNISDLMLIGNSIVSYAIDMSKTNNSNVELCAYFLNQSKEKIDKIETNIGSEDLTLYIDVSVKNEGYFNGSVKIEDSNFNVKQENLNPDVISEISGNTIKLNQVNAGTTITIPLGIEAIKNDNINIQTLNKESKVRLEGEYINSETINKNQHLEINGESSVYINWKSSEKTEAQIDTKIITNSIYKTEEEKRVVQLLVNSKITNNNYPVKNTSIEIETPKDVEEVKVHSRNNKATNSNIEFNETNYVFNKEENKLTINVSNEDETNISWNKDAEDSFVVTFIFNKEENVQDKSISTNCVITTYDDKELKAKSETIIESEIDGIVSYSVDALESSIYKGKIYTGEEREYKTNTTINVDYLNVVDSINLKEDTSEYLANENIIQANTIYKETRINKAEFLKIFGEEGIITIKNSNQTIEINKDSETDENGNIVIKYTNIENNLEFITSKPIALGTLKIENTKSLLNSNLSREDINDLTYLKENIVGSYNNKKEIKNYNNIELKNTSTKAILNVNTGTLSTTESNKKVKITTVLENNGENKDLYKNPIIKITLPKQVKEVSAKCKLLYGNGLELGEAGVITDNGKHTIEIHLNGEQTTYNTETVEGTKVVVYADLELDKLSVNSDEKITLNYSNEIATSYEDNGEENTNISIVGNNGIITTNNISEYGIETIGDEGRKEVPLVISTESKNATVNISTINNEDSDIKDVKILGTFPTGENDNLGITLTSGINVISENISTKVYYSDNEEANADLADSSNGWKTTGNANTSKKYLIIIDQLKVGEKLEANYAISIPEGLHYNMKAEESYSVTYKNESIENEKTAKATIIALNTGNGPDLDISVKEIVGNELVGEVSDENNVTGQDITSGEIIKYEVALTNKGNETATNVQITDVVPQGARALELASGKMQEDNEEGTFGKPVKSFKEIESDTIDLMIDAIGNGETKKVNLYLIGDCRLLDDKIDTLSNEIIIKYKDEEKKRLITNKLKPSNTEITLFAGDNESDESILEAEKEYKYCLSVLNMLQEKSLNADIEFETNDLFEITKIEYYDDNKENNENYEGDIVKDTNKVSIKNINELQDIYVYVKAKNNTESKKAELYAIVTENNNTIRSNQILKNVKSVNVSMDLKATNVGENVQSGQEIDYTISINNSQEGIDVNNFIIKDYLCNFIDILSVEIDRNSISDEDYSIDNDKSEDSDLKVMTLRTSLKKGKTSNILIKTRVNEEIESYEDLQIENKADAEVADKIIASTDKVVHTLSKTYKPEKLVGNDPESTTQKETEQPNSETPKEENQQPSDESQGDSDKKEQNKTTYTISGTAWQDLNEDGKRDNNEPKLSNIPVVLIDTKTNNEKTNGTTDSDGFYSFSNIEIGKYLVAFKYDTNKYILTKYQADGVSGSKNSDAETSNITLNEESQKVAVTDTIEIINNSKENIDLGLIEAKTFDLELTKTINKVTVSNSRGTQTQNYNDANLAKVEIRAKELKGTMVVVEYKIKVKNNGEVAGYAKNIVDYKPTDLSFNSSMNKDWYQSGDYVYSTNLANTKIEAGETKELTLVLTKTMTESNTGLVNNTAEIQAVYNNLGIADLDSKPANKQKAEDDMGSCDLIISVKTGAAISYIALTLSIIIILAIGAYIAGKKILRKRIEF